MVSSVKLCQFLLFLTQCLAGKYGSYNKQTKQWDGLVQHLLDRVSVLPFKPSTHDFANERGGKFMLFIALFIMNNLEFISETTRA